MRYGSVTGLLVVLLTGVLLLAGCGSSPAPEPADRTAEDLSPEVVSVSMTQQGGQAGSLRSWRVTERSPRHEHVFAAAAPRALEDTTARGDGRPACCGLLEFEVVIRYADGTTTSLRTGAADSTAPALQELVWAVLDSEPLRPDAEGKVPGTTAEQPVQPPQPSA